MDQERPRRADRPALAKRILRIGVPGLMIAGLATGAAAAVWPDQQTAEPAASSVAAPAQGMRSDRPNRDSERAALPDKSASAASASAAAKKAAAEKRAAAAKKVALAKKAAAEKAAEKKAAEEAAAKKAAAEKKAAEKAAAEKKAAAERAAKKRAAALADFAELGDRDGSKYATSEVNVRVGAGTDYDAVTTIDEGDKVAVTERREDGWTQVDLDGKGRWIRSDLLTEQAPAPAQTDSGSDSAASDSDDSSSDDSASDDSDSDGLSGATCSSGSSVEDGLTPDAIKVHRAICAKFPQVSSFGGVRPDSLPEHPSGRALDSMISDSSVGWQIANWAREHHSELGISEVIYSQQIWTVQRSSEGWRSMPDRGSASANHYDHVHVTVYGNSAG